MFSFFHYEFMQRAFMAIVAISLFAPLLGVFLVLRRQSLMSDTLSHVSLAGVAFGLFLGISPNISTLIVVILAAILLEYLRTVYRDFLEVATAILMSVGLSLALIFANAGRGKGVNLDQYLFGSIVTVSQTQVILLAVLAVIVLVAFALFMRPMYVMTFDEDTAFVDGLPVKLMSTIFNIVTGIAIALMIPVAGALLVSAIMVMPASIAMRIGLTFKRVLAIAVLIGFVGMLFGLIISYQTGAPASATITLVFVAVFVLTLLAQKIQNLR
ncbi:ABC transporter permease [Lactococcus hodotermopsidis]|uniref:ABC transporter permease n=1 Tax=Pseudolactococcus hodotermopsidis TaxID=2709157 RepID=A0A6A0BDC1_9LACT|nr:metal ABC transporter permease [Lactococcus hodotermopsidis]GFH42464.1 ABC transporter permease [Lactococcus hodotermopsidis]